MTRILCEAIGAQRNPSLRDLYELVVKAVRAGVLQTESHPLPPPIAPANWRLSLGGGAMKWIAGISFVAAAVSAILRPMPMAFHPIWLVLGWLAACAAVSLGWVLGAAVVRAAGGEVYRPRLVWRPLGPVFAVDLDDAIMGGRATMENAALARLVPLFLLISAAAWTEPGLLFPLLAGALIQLSPLWRSPLHDLLAALYRDPQLATAYDFVFARDRLFTLLVRARQQIGDHKYLLVCAAATVGWLLLVFSCWHGDP